jgi:hypothetical protein
MGATDYQAYLEKSRAVIPTELGFDYVVANRALPVRHITVPVFPAWKANAVSHVRFMILWDTYSMFRMMQKISSSFFGYRTTLGASMLFLNQIKHSHLHGSTK